MNSYVPGGVKTLLRSYASHLDPDGFQVDWIVSEDPFSQAETDAEKNGGKAFLVPSVKRPAKYVSCVFKILREGDYDIAQACMNSLNVFPLVAARRAGVPVRISYSLSSAHPSEGGVRTVTKRALRQLSSVGVTHRAANCKLSGEWLFGIGTDFQVIPNTYDGGVYHLDENLRTAMRAAHGWEGKLLVGHIGRFEPQKNHALLVDIFAELAARRPDAHLVLVGFGSLKDQILAKLDGLGLAGRYTDLGSTEDIAGVYNALDCFVLPSLFEGMPVVGIEAQATGLPCVFSDEVTREVAVNSNVAFLPLSASPVVWAEAIVEAAAGGRVVDRRGLSSFEVNQATRMLEGYYRLIKPHVPDGLPQ